MITNLQQLTPQELLETVTSSMPIVLFAINIEGDFILSEGRGLEKLGLKTGEVVGKSAFEMYKDNDAVTTSLKKALAGKENRTFIRVGDIHFEMQVSPLRNKARQIIGLVGVAMDITESEVTKKALKKRNEELELLIKTMAGREARMSELKEKMSALLKGNYPITASTDICRPDAGRDPVLRSGFRPMPE